MGGEQPKRKSDKMNLQQFLKNVAGLVGEMRVIKHGQFRCAHEPWNVIDIAIFHGIKENEVQTETIGDNDLKRSILEIAQRPDLIWEADAERVIGNLDALWNVYLGDVLDDYTDAEDDSLNDLDALIDAALEFAGAVTSTKL